MRRTISILCLLPSFLLLAGCFGTNGGLPKVTLEPGGAYSDPVVAQADDLIDKTLVSLKDFVAWAKTTPWSDVQQLGAQVEANKNEWIRQAYEARDAYYRAAKAWRDAKAADDPTVDPDTDPQVAERHQLLKAALAVLDNIAQQIIAARQAHQP